MGFIEIYNIVKSAEYQNWLVLFIDSLEEKSFYYDIEEDPFLFREGMNSSYSSLIKHK